MLGARLVVCKEPTIHGRPCKLGSQCNSSQWILVKRERAGTGTGSRKAEQADGGPLDLFLLACNCAAMRVNMSEMLHILTSYESAAEQSDGRHSSKTTLVHRWPITLLVKRREGGSIRPWATRAIGEARQWVSCEALRLWWATQHQQPCISCHNLQ